MRALNASHPNRWKFAGILRRMTYEGSPARIATWDGAVREARDGDELLVLQTPHGITVATIDKATPIRTGGTA